MVGKQRSEWRHTTMGEVVAFFASGDPFLKLEYSTFGVPVLAKGDVKPFGRLEHGESRYIAEELISKRGFRLTEPGDYLLTTRDLTQAANFLGLLAPIPDDQTYLVNQGANVIRFTDAVNGRFAVYWCNGPVYRAYIKGHYVGSTQIHIRKQDFLDAPLWLPELSEQQAIADILGSLDDKIELNRRTSETLEAMARTLFRSWFVDFDPVRAKADGQTPPGLDAATARLFPASFEPSALGPIPKGWRVKPIGEVVDVVGGSTPSTDEPSYWNGPHHFATPKDMAALSSPVLLTTERTITASGLERISSGLLAAGTVLLSSRAPIGYLAITEVPVAVNQGFIAMKCPDGMPNHYVLHWTRENMAEIVAHANGTTFLEISKTNFRPLKALVPDAKLLKAFADFVSPLHQRVVANLQETNTLAATRDALLPKLLSGEVRVGDAERIAEGVA